MCGKIRKVCRAGKGSGTQKPVSDPAEKGTGALRLFKPGAFRYCAPMQLQRLRRQNYEPKATYSAMENTDDKLHDAFLATDCIGTEKLVSGEYNTDVFNFGDSGVRKLLADIQVEEQNHAEMLYKYKTVNGMK